MLGFPPRPNLSFGKTRTYQISEPQPHQKQNQPNKKKTLHFLEREKKNKTKPNQTHSLSSFLVRESSWILERETMVQVAKRKKGRPSKADLARRVAESQAAAATESDSRRSLRRKNVRYNIIEYDGDYVEDDEEDERKREKKKLKLMAKLQQEEREEELEENEDHAPMEEEEEEIGEIEGGEENEDVEEKVEEDSAVIVLNL